MFISPQEIKKQAQRCWDKQVVLRDYLGTEDSFPLEVRFKKPSSRALLDNFSAYKHSLTELVAQSKEKRGHGYSIAWKSLEHRRLGQQQLPERIYFQDREDLLKFIGRAKEYQRFKKLSQRLLAGFPQLAPWLNKHPLRALKHESIFEKIIQICRYFLAHPYPNCHIRELDIPGVDSKFIEQHKNLLSDLLDILLPEDAIDKSCTKLSGSGFAKRYGLNYDQTQIRFRLLDSTLAPHIPYRDINIPKYEFDKTNLPCRRVFIVENKNTGLSFPPVPNSIVIFGLGYGISELRDASWLKQCQLYYWGDIDTHGFAILSRLRSYFPSVQSLLMDRNTLLKFRNLWGTEDAKRFSGTLKCLTEDERQLFEEIRDDMHGKSVRLEQERVSYKFAKKRIDLATKV